MLLTLHKYGPGRSLPFLALYGHQIGAPYSQPSHLHLQVTSFIVATLFRELYLEIYRHL